MTKIKSVYSAQIIDSRGNPTIQSTVLLSDGAIGIASSPSGASVGTYEAVELRDRNKDSYNGMSVYNAIKNVETIIAPHLIGMDATKQKEIDKTMIDVDGTQNKGRLGANAMLSVSMAVCKAAAQSNSMPLFLYIRELIKHEESIPKIPTPIFNLINGGKHAGGNIDFQEYHVIPASSKPYSESLKIGVNLLHRLKEILKENNKSTLAGDEGGFGPTLSNNQEAFSLLKKSIEKEELRLGYDVFFGLDAAANSFYSSQAYNIKDKEITFSTDAMITYYQELEKPYPLLYLEDPLSENDWDGWVKISSLITQGTLIVGDDLTVTNPYRLQMALDKKAVTGIIIKPNQIGTIIESLAVVEVARQAGLKIIVSHRSGETNDDFIADFAVGISADYAKFGAPARGERVAKYNRLLQIEREIQSLSNQKSG